MGSGEEASVDMVQNKMRTRLDIFGDKNGGLYVVR